MEVDVFKSVAYERDPGLDRKNKYNYSFEDLNKSFDEATSLRKPVASLFRYVKNGSKWNQLIIIDPTRKVKIKDVNTHIIQDKDGLDEFKTDVYLNIEHILRLKNFRIYRKR